MIRRFTKPFILALALLFASPGHSARAEFLNAAFESVWGRFLFSQTAEGTEILALLSRENLALESAENRLIRRNLDESFQRIGERFEIKSRRKLKSDAPLTLEEKVLLKSLAAKELRINPEWSSLDRTHIEYLSPTPESGLENLSEEFLAFKQDPARAPESRTPERGTGRIRKYLAEAKSCLQNMPLAARKHNDFWYTARQLGIDELMTVTGKVIAAGSQPVQWKDLPADLVYEAIGSVGTSRFSMTTGTFMLNWVKLAGFGVGHAGGDAVFYSVVPMKESHGDSDAEAVIDRLKYNILWSTLDAPLQIGLYNLIAGMECLGKGRGWVVGLQLGSGLATNIAYFGARNLFMSK